MVTIDASVWVAADTADEDAHDDCAAFLLAVMNEGIAIHQPTLSVVEVSAAVARRTRDAQLAREAVDTMRSMPGLTLHDLDLALATRASDIAGASLLRGADAVYAAVASSVGSTLVTLDDELLTRSPTGVETVTPRAWLDRRP